MPDSLTQAERRFLRVAALEGHAAWEDLREHVKDMRERELANLAKQIMTGSDRLDRETLAFMRGKYAGMVLVLDLPADAAKAAAKESGS